VLVRRMYGLHVVISCWQELLNYTGVTSLWQEGGGNLNKLSGLTRRLRLGWCVHYVWKCVGEWALCSFIRGWLRSGWLVLCVARAFVLCGVRVVGGGVWGGVGLLTGSGVFMVNFCDDC